MKETEIKNTKTANAKTLNYYLRTYDGVTKLSVASQNRGKVLLPDGIKTKTLDEIKAFDSTKGSLKTQISHILDDFPVWTEWLEHVPGIGEFIAGNLISLYYFKYVPICKKCGEGDLEKIEHGLKCNKCGKSAEGDGLLDYRIEDKDFRTITAWWSYMGRWGVDGHNPKRKSGEQLRHSPRGRNIGYAIGESFFGYQKSEHLYKAFCLGRIEKREKTHPSPKYTATLRKNYAKNEMIKLFLSHFWQVARTLDGKSTEGPYVQVVMGHTGIIPPYYFDPERLKK